MDCRCGGTMQLEHRVILNRRRRSGRRGIGAGVPIRVCQRCGEAWPERDNSRKIEELL